MLKIEALLGLNDIDGADRLIHSKITLTDVREGEVSLTELWFRLQAMKKARALNVELTDALIEEMTQTLPPPRELDFRMK